jgi:hypothetical protein
VLVVQNFRMAERIGGQEVDGVQLDEAHDDDDNSDFCFGGRKKESRGCFSNDECLC